VQVNNNTCAGIEIFNITQKPLPVIASLGDTTVCFDEVKQLLLDAGQFTSYLWQPTGETTRTIYSSQASVYMLTVTDTNQCSLTKLIAVMETCPENVWIPNAFTPNGDGINDELHIGTRAIDSYALFIYNRWGHPVFKGSNNGPAWNGNDAPNDVHTYLLQYNIKNKPTQVLKGTITLIR